MTIYSKIKKSTIVISIVYLILAIITIYSRVYNINDIQNIAKPLLMPTLMFLVYKNGKLSTKYMKFVFFALFFSMLGDVFLMPLVDNFIIGLANFMIAHIIYIIAFYKDNSDKLLLGLSKRKILSVSLLIGLVILLWILINGMIITDTPTFLMIAVVIYAMVISIMSLNTISVFGNRNILGNKLVLIGAVLFMFSDSIIALNKFVSPIEFSGLYIMTTYTIAQWLIVFGSIKNIEAKF